MHMRTVVSAAVVLILSSAGSAAAQSGAGSITATANVFQALAVTGAQALDFGNVFPGVNKSVAVTDGGAGRFDVTGQSSAPVTMTFALPANLQSGANNLPITSWTGHHNTSNAPTGGTSFTPSGAATGATLSGGATGALFVFVGAQVQPGGAQPAGTYTGTVTLTVVY